MKWKTGVVAVLAVGLIGIIVQYRSRPDFGEAVERSSITHAAVVEIVTALFGPPSGTSRDFEGRFCSGLGGPTGKQTLELKAEWELTGFDEDKVAALLDDVQEFLAQVDDIAQVERAPRVTGGLRVTAQGKFFSTAVLGPVAPDAERFVLTVLTGTICGYQSGL